MTHYHLVVTLTGTAKPLTTDRSIVACCVYLQPGAANGNPMFVGGNDSTGTYVATASSLGVRLPAPDADGNVAPFPYAPFNTQIQIPLWQIWVNGTNTETVQVDYWTI